MGRTMSPEDGDVGDALTGWVADTVGDLVDRHLPDWRIPGTFGGHPVEPDVAADLANTLGHLHSAGVAEVAGTSVVDAVARVLRRTDGRRTHTFFSYRVAETVARFGDFRHSPLTTGWSAEEIEDLAAACDSTDWIPLLDSGLPRNYAAVLARCEAARRHLGLLDDLGAAATLDPLVERTREMLAANSFHMLDDSSHGVGRHDIYAADVWLFTLPLAEHLGELWVQGARSALSLVERVGTPDGTSVAWGRSTGSLGIALTLELAALALTHPVELTAHRGLWAQRASGAATALKEWFHDGLVTAHQHRSPYGYRGPFRRLQMTLDLLGKVAWAGEALRGSRGVPLPGTPVDLAVAYPPVDELVALDPDRPAGVWACRGSGPSFVVPFVGATRSDYLAAPRSPGLYEVPVDSALACWVPVVVDRHRTWAPAGVPDSLTHRPGGVTATWHALRPLGDLDPAADTAELPGRTTLTYRVEGRSLVADLHLELASRPWAVSVVVPEVQQRPLRIELLSATPAVHCDVVDSSGLAEWRSFWHELPVVHQLDVDCDGASIGSGTGSGTDNDVALAFRVTPTVRVASTAYGHHYHDSLYGTLEADHRVVTAGSPIGPFAQAGTTLADADVFHLHWPEWFAFDDLALHHRLSAELRHAEVPVLLTAHNLTPHDKAEEAHEPIYQLWADTADAVLHHSRWGLRRFTDRYGQGHATHHVVPHCHFGDLHPSAGTPRHEAEVALGLEPAPLRIGVLGAPRVEKHTGLFLRGVVASTNPDIQVCCWSLDPTQRAVAGEALGDPRVAVAEDYHMVDAATYGLRLASCDVLALPFDPDGDMLGTGLVADVLGHGLGALGTEWPYLAETLGGALIPMGDSVVSIAAAIDALDPDTVAGSRSAAVRRAPAVSPAAVAEQTFTIIESLL